ncbi:MAG: hypothetical protein QM784_19050 [Polyangiaceae bacterium]
MNGPSRLQNRRFERHVEHAPARYVEPSLALSRAQKSSAKWVAARICTERRVQIDEILRRDANNRSYSELASLLLI